jgi:hypothetical protein
VNLDDKLKHIGHFKTKLNHYQAERQVPNR